MEARLHAAPKPLLCGTVGSVLAEVGHETYQRTSNGLSVWTRARSGYQHKSKTKRLWIPGINTQRALTAVYNPRSQPSA